jgi:hypothetical protein
VQGIQGTFDVDIGVAAAEALFGASFGFASAFYIDLTGTLGGFGEDGDFVREDFGKTTSERQALLLSALGMEGKLSDRQFRDQWGVAGQDTQISVLARNLGFGRVGVDDLLLRRNDLELECVCHQWSVSGIQCPAYFL